MVKSSIRRFKTICVFGSIEFGKNKEYLKAAAELGITLATQKIDLVYRNSFGLKDTVTVSANIRGSRILDVILKALIEKRYVTGITIDNELYVLSIHERMTYINHNINAYIVLSEGLEIWKDVFNITSWTQLNNHKKSLGLLNVNGFLFFLDHTVE